MLHEGIVLRFDIDHLEKKALDLLPFVDGNVDRARDACVYFGAILNLFFESLSTGNPYRQWCIDGLWCEKISFEKDRISFSGSSYWLSGGGDCPQFRLDIGSNFDELRYSFKFLSDKKFKQQLYIAKLGEEWKLADA